MLERDCHGGAGVMLRLIELEKLIHEESIRICDELLKIAKKGGSEENIRTGCDKLICQFIESAGIKLEIQHEYPVPSGRIDSKYGGVIIEYKKADTITIEHSKNTQAVINQLKMRFKDFKEQEKVDPEKIFGVGTDASTFIFVRNRNGKVVVSEPVNTNSSVVEKLLRALVASGAIGRSLTPDNLAEDFGGDTAVANFAISNLYDSLSATEENKVKTFYKQWRLLFSQVGGLNDTIKAAKFKNLGKYYDINKDEIDYSILIFSIHTYYDIIIKLITSEMATSSESFAGSIIGKLVHADLKGVYETVRKMESGGLWKELGIRNFLEGDLFLWYLADWNDRVAELIHRIASKLDRYDISTLSGESSENQDLLKSLFQRLFPKTLRHDMGEYYTPDWMAEFLLNEIGYDGNPDKRLLDPACGSGTFLVCAINRTKRWFSQHRFEVEYGERELLEKITNNIIGFDLNPMAVIASRANYLFALADLVHRVGSIEIPVYLCDSIMRPSEGDRQLFEGEIVFETAIEGVSFRVPKEVVGSLQDIETFSTLIEECVKNGYTSDEFVNRCKDKGFSVEKELDFKALYKQMQELHNKGMNGIWARILKNAFAPLFVRPVDFVIGNPPWINWESLPVSYRSKANHHKLWTRYDLFRQKGYKAKLGGAKDDLSVLLTYVAVDEYLKEGGKIGFIITQSVFKTKGGGEGFRTFCYEKYREEKTYYIQPLMVHDLSDFQCFEGTTNRTSIFIGRKSDKAFDYPVPYTVWSKVARGRLDTRAKLEEIEQKVDRVEISAEPVDSGKPTSPWLTAPAKALAGIKKVLGRSDYKAHEGVNSGGLNGAYWVKMLREFPEGDLLIENLGNVGKKKVKTIQRRIEGDLVYPLLRGRDVKRWSAEPSCHMIMPNRTDKLAGIEESTMKREYPKTYAYFKDHEVMLRGRSGYKAYFKHKPDANGYTDPFYSIYNVGPYTMSPYKVLWREQSASFISAVVGSDNGRLVLPDHKLMFISCDNENESYYLSSILNSSPSCLTVSSYVISTSTSTHILDNIHIPKFNPEDKTHLALADLSKHCHEETADGNTDAVVELESEIDRLASRLWGISETELSAIQRAIADA